MNRLRIMILCFALLLFAAVPAVAGSSAQAANSSRIKEVRVAFPLQSGLWDYADDGSRTGYFYEYLEKIAQYTEWRYEFVNYDGADRQDVERDVLNDLKNGYIDIVGGYTYDATFPARYECGYTAHSCGMRYTVLQARGDASADVEINSQRDQHFRIAIEGDGGDRRAELDAYCAAYRITYDAVVCDDLTAQIAALRDGDADLMLGDNLTFTEGLRTVARFAPRPIYFLVSDKSSVLGELDNAMVGIERTDPQFADTLYQKYFVAENRTPIFTEEERAYIAQAETLDVGILMTQAPYQYVEDGQTKGINVSVLGYIAEKTGLKFSFTPVRTVEELFALANGLYTDLIAGMPYDYRIALQQNVAMTRTFVTAPYVMLMNGKVDAEELGNKKLALLSTSTYHGPYVGTPVRFETTPQCLDAVVSGVADYTYVDANTAQYYLNRPGYSRLKLAPQTYEPRKICFGVVKNGNGELLSICNKVIGSIPEIEMQAIINGIVLRTQKYTLSMMISDHPFGFIMTVVGSIAVIAAVLTVFLVYRAKMNKKSRIELRKLHRVFALVNEYFFEYDFHKRLLTVSLPDAKSGEASVSQYDLTADITDADDEESRGRLLQLLTSERNADTLSMTSGGVRHWYRIAVERMYDAEVPVFAIGKLTQVDAEMERETQLEERVRLDSLTGILNAGAIREYVADDLKSGETERLRALILLDVDHFKSVNDNYGHLEGDRTLQKVARSLDAAYGEQGYVGRPGGDEFMVFLRDVGSEERLNGICREMEASAQSVRLTDGKEVTFSIGAAVAAEGERYDDLYQRADSALYAAKRAGRNRYRIAAPRRGGVRHLRAKVKT